MNEVGCEVVAGAGTVARRAGSLAWASDGTPDGVWDTLLCCLSLGDRARGAGALLDAFAQSLPAEPDDGVGFAVVVTDGTAGFVLRHGRVDVALDGQPLPDGAVVPVTVGGTRIAAGDPAAMRTLTERTPTPRHDLRDGSVAGAAFRWASPAVDPAVGPALGSAVGPDGGAPVPAGFPLVGGPGPGSASGFSSGDAPDSRPDMADSGPGDAAADSAPGDAAANSAPGDAAADAASAPGSGLDDAAADAAGPESAADSDPDDAGAGDSDEDAHRGPGPAAGFAAVGGPFAGVPEPEQVVSHPAPAVDITDVHASVGAGAGAGVESDPGQTEFHPPPQTGATSEQVPARNAGVLVFEDGTTATLTDDVVLGRRPDKHQLVQSGQAQPFVIHDPEHVLSSAHAALRMDGGGVTVVDLDSLNGTHVAAPDAREWTKLTAGAPYPMHDGYRLLLGWTVLTYRSPN